MDHSALVAGLGKEISMMRIFLAALFVAAAASLACIQNGANASDPPYGANPAAAHTFSHDGVALYYETYGRGDLLLLVHGNGNGNGNGNGGSIADLAAQIAHFSTSYRVVAMDSRDQGRSSDSPGDLTYEKMSDDLAALLDHLDSGPAHVLGWSDGGIQALLLAIRHPAKVKSIIAVAANLNSTEDAFPPNVAAWLESYVEAISDDESPEGKRAFKVARIMLKQPSISRASLESITAPAPIMAGDRDLVRDEHTVDIFHHIPNSQLAIFPNATHMLPYDEPASFNATVERFLRNPSEGKDRIRDLETSLDQTRTAR
jgi:pimeloyl-ACP methyl ester carboxylesterase